METTEILIGALGLFVAFGVGIWSLTFAKSANGKAQKANELAKTANSIAAQALAQAAESNQIAEDANRLSEEANTFAQRAIAQQEEDWFVNWRPEWNGENNTLTLRNTGAKTARDLTVVVTSGPVHHVSNGLGDVEASSEVVFEVPEIGEHRVERDAQISQENMALLAFGKYSTDPYWRQKAKIMVRWKSELGFPDHKLIEMKLP